MRSRVASDLRQLFYSCDRLCSRKATLQEHQVEPAAEFESDLVKLPGLGESQAFMQLDGCSIVGVDPRDHAVLLNAGPPSHEFDHQGPSDALAAAVGADMD